jgi:hypothetical protein
MHCTKNLIYVFPEMKLRDLVPDSYIYKCEQFIFTPYRSAYLAVAK